MQKNKLKTEKLVAILVAVVLLAVLSFGIYQSNLNNVPSKFQTARDNNGGLNPMASYDFESIKKGYDDFSLSNAENLVKVKFISREDRAYCLGDDGYMLFISEDENKDEYGKPIYPSYNDVLLTLEVQTSYWGEFQKGDTIKVVYQAEIKPLADAMEDTKEAILTLSRATQEKEEEIYEMHYSYTGMFYLYKNRVYPAFDMTYEEVYGIKGLGNPVKKYMGMKEKDFEEQMRALRK